LVALKCFQKFCNSGANLNNAQHFSLLLQDDTAIFMMDWKNTGKELKSGVFQGNE